MNKTDFFSFLGPDADVIRHFSDAELDKAVEEMGLAKAAATIITHGAVIEKIKRELDEDTGHNGLPKELNDAINSKRAKHLFFLGFSFQANEDDRMGINIDNLFANFALGLSYKDPKKFLEDSQKILISREDLGDFLMRTPEDYLKVLIYHLKLTKLEDIFAFFAAFEEQKDEISNAGQKVFSYGSPYYYHFREATRAPTEFISSLSAARLSKILSIFQVQNMQGFIDLFLRQPHMYSFFLMVHIPALEYFAKTNALQSAEKCCAFFQNEDYRKKLISLNTLGEIGTQNLLYILELFEITDIEALSKFDERLIKTLSGASKRNLEILFEVYEPTSLDVFLSVLSRPYISTNIEGVEYSHIRKLFGLLKIAALDQKTILKRLIETSYDAALSGNMQKLSDVLQKYSGNIGNLGYYILSLLSRGKGLEENAEELIKVLDSLDSILSQPGTSKYIDFSRLIELSDFMGGYITSYLAQEILKTSDTAGLIASWEKEVEHYKQGNFDPKNALHRNLEYKNFKSLSSDENIAKYMGRKFTFSQYERLFDNGNGTYDLHEKDQFELDCVAYEAGLLKDYIFKLNQEAKKLGRRLMVVPNLTYGYLPLCAIAHELEKDDNIDICIGPKVGSTESHGNTEVLNRSLFKGKREYIINKKPIIVVIDGTQHLVHREDGEKSARYPDAHRGYLNQVIAINYALGYDKIEHMNYGYAGKEKADLERLIRTPEFQRTVEVYKSLFHGQKGTLYTFGLWNTANDTLILRNGEKEPTHIAPFQAESLTDPTLIFCNVGVHHNDLPVELRKRRQQHTPGYFDDSGRIINFEYRYDSTGIHFVNSMEAYLQKRGGSTKTRDTSALIRHAVPVTSE